jgi:hypothetical protein
VGWDWPLRFGLGGQVYQLAVQLLDLAIPLDLNQHGKRMAHQGGWVGCDLDGFAASFDKLRQELIGKVGWMANAGYLRLQPGVIIRTLARGKSGWIAVLNLRQLIDFRLEPMQIVILPSLDIPCPERIIINQINFHVYLYSVGLIRFVFS